MKKNKNIVQIRTEDTVVILKNRNGKCFRFHMDLLTEEIGNFFQNYMNSRMENDEFVSASGLYQEFCALRKLQGFMSREDILSIADVTIQDLNSFAKYLAERYVKDSVQAIFRLAKRLVILFQEDGLPQVQPQPQSEEDLLPIGNGIFFDDTWDLSSMGSTHVCGGLQKLHFGFIRNAGFKMPVKRYIYHNRKIKSPQTLYGALVNLKPFIRYCEANGLTGWADVNLSVMQGFYRYMKNLNPVPCVLYKYACGEVDRVFRAGETHPEWGIAPYSAVQEFFDAQRRKPKKYVLEESVKEADFIPVSVYQNILYHALRYEEDPYTKASLIIQAETGLTINRVISLKEGCLEQMFDGRYLLTFSDRGKSYTIMVNNLVRDAVLEMQELTAPLREESGMKEIFIARNLRNLHIGICSTTNWTRTKYKPFIQRFGICGADGELYPLQTQQFTATFMKRVFDEENQSIEAVEAKYPYLPMTGYRNRKRFLVPREM